VIGVDTNVLVRYLTQDDSKHSPIAARFLERELSRERPGYVTSVVLCETVWVLSRAYKLDRAVVVGILDRILAVESREFEHVGDVLLAVEDFRASRLGFADCVVFHVTRRVGCEALATFDRDLARRPGARLLA
jgi:predicted nucleic-acid-binding protein